YLPARPRRYKTTTRNAQEAHEAIRPTDPARTPEMLKGKIPDDAWKLYTLIWQRAVACQMSAAKLELVTAHIEAGSAQLTASGSTVVFDGYRRLYEEARDEKEAPAKILPPLREQEELRLIKVMPKQHFTEPKPRYTEASLIRELEKQGVGRPSTYAAIIDVLKKRGYVRVEKRRFHPTDVGEVVNRFLVKHFPDIVNIGFTAQMEEKLDAIARGEEPWKPVLRAFWEPFSAQVDKTLRETTKKEVTTEPLDEACPECGRPLVVRLGRYGRFIGCSGYPECSYTREREEAEQEAADAPACAKCGAPMQKKRGRFGAFWGCSRYPECDHTEPLVKPEATGIRCPACGEGEIVRRRSRRGRAFWGCSRYPECRFVLWDEPVAKGCPECGHPFVVRKRSKKHGTQLVCPNEGCAWQEAETSEHAA
ncbi:MAG: DNA topoisomerase I, partial [Zetaproteobacteria bacterium]